MRRKILVALVAALALAGSGALIATAAVPDPCDSLSSNREYMKCRFDRIEKRLDEMGVPSPSVTPTATPSPSQTPTVSPSPSVTPTPSPTQTPTPTPTVTTPPPSTGFPDAGNTGVPDGTVLTTYTGPLTITTPTVIDGKKITGRLIVKASLTIRNSTLTGTIDGDYGKPLLVEDSNLNGGSTSYPTVGYGDVTIRRSEITGGQHNVLCGTNCVVEDSWLHDQALPSNQGFHNNAYISNGGSNVVLRHNTVHCTPKDNSVGGGCTADVSFFGDFSTISNVTVDNNLFKTTPGGYCGTFGLNPSKPYGSNPTGVKVTDNVFERGAGKCGYWGPVTSFLVGNGNEWAGNKFDDGTPVNP